MQPYASRTGTRRNLDALRAAGWRLMLSPAGVLRTEGFRYCLDNGAWSAFMGNAKWRVVSGFVGDEYSAGNVWNPVAFQDALERFGPDADFVVTPDIVMGGAESLARTKEWLPRVLDNTRLALVAVQNGMVPDQIRPLLNERVGVFVGGDTAWKERTMGTWAALARECSSYCHVGRVNSQRRVRICQMAGVDSFDGSGPSRMTKHLHQMQRALVQGSFMFGGSSHETT